MSTRALALVIGIVRTAGGVAGYFWPTAFAKYGKVPGAGASADSRYVTRLFGARDIVIGVATIVGPARRAALWMGAVCDFLDTVSGWSAGREGKDARFVRAAGAITSLFTLAGLYTGLRWSVDREEADR